MVFFQLVMFVFGGVYKLAYGNRIIDEDSRNLVSPVPRYENLVEVQGATITVYALCCGHIALRLFVSLCNSANCQAYFTLTLVFLLLFGCLCLVAGNDSPCGGRA